MELPLAKLEAWIRRAAATMVPRVDRDELGRNLALPAVGDADLALVDCGPGAADQP